jgi:hypothetical protein
MKLLEIVGKLEKGLILEGFLDERWWWDSAGTL